MRNRRIYAQAAVLALCLQGVGTQAEFSASTAPETEPLALTKVAAKNVRGLNRGSAAATEQGTETIADLDSVIKERRGQRPDADNYGSQDYRPKQPRRY